MIVESGPLQAAELYHHGIVVDDFDAALLELGQALGLRWASTVRRTFPVAQPGGVFDADFRVTYSVDGPLHVEIIEACPGTIWASTGGGIHHRGYWVDDLAATSTALDAAGWRCEGTYHNPDHDGPFGFTYHTLPTAGLRIELVDRGRKPAFDTWIAGGDFPSALEPGGMSQ